jgi:flagellar protein FlgJ
MTDFAIGRAGLASGEASGPREKLRQAANEFEGVFIAQLFREMRATIPTEEGSGQDQELFISMLDDTLAREMAGRTSRGLGDALYRQLVARFGEPASTEGVTSGGK